MNHRPIRNQVRFEQIFKKLVQFFLVVFFVRTGRFDQDVKRGIFQRTFRLQVILRANQRILIQEFECGQYFTQIPSSEIKNFQDIFKTQTTWYYEETIDLKNKLAI